MSNKELDAARRVAARHAKLELAQLVIADGHELTSLRSELAAAREALETIRQTASDLHVYDLACQALARHQQEGKADGNGAS